MVRHSLPPSRRSDSTKSLLTSGRVWAQHHRRAIERMYMRGLSSGIAHPLILSFSMSHPHLRAEFAQSEVWQAAKPEQSGSFEFIAIPGEDLSLIVSNLKSLQIPPVLAFMENPPEGKYLVLGTDGYRTLVCVCDEP